MSIYSLLIEHTFLSLNIAMDEGQPYIHVRMLCAVIFHKILNILRYKNGKTRDQLMTDFHQPYESLLHYDALSHSGCLVVMGLRVLLVVGL